MSKAAYPASQHDRPHARIYHHWLNHPSWRKLSPRAFKIITYLLASYRPNKPNAFPVGERRLLRECGCAAKSSRSAISELLDGGFLREERRGRNRGCGSGRERVISLTMYDTETTCGDPDLPIKVWQASQK